MRAHIPQQEWLEDTLAVLGLGFSNSLGGLTQMKFTFDRYRWPVYSLFPERIVTNRHHTGDIQVTYGYIRVTYEYIRTRPNPWWGGRVGGQGKLKETNPFRKVRLLTCAFSFLSFFLANLGSSIRVYLYFWRMWGRVFVCTRMSVVCTRMLLVCTLMYSYVSRMLLLCYRMYSYVLVCTRMSLVCHPCGILVTIP